MTNTELVLACSTLFFACMFYHAMLERWRAYGSGYRNGRIAAGIEYDRRNATPPASDTVERLVASKNERNEA